MRLDFNVLWVEDQPDAVQAQIEKITRLIGDEGFRLRVKFAGSVHEAASLLSSEIFGDHIDLILMDYDLGPGPKGDEGLLQVRKIFPFKDIVFYSSRAPDLLRLVAEKQAQGVFSSARQDLPDSVLGVFEALVKKVLDIDHSRGIVLGATSDIDNYVNDCLVAMFDSGDEPFRQSALSNIVGRMVAIRKRFDEGAKSIEAAKHVSDVLDFYSIYTSNDRLTLLRKLLDVSGRYRIQSDSIKKYISETIPKRNILAHVRARQTEFSRKLFDSAGKELSIEDMKKLRRDLIDVQEMFEALASALKSKQ